MHPDLIDAFAAQMPRLDAGERLHAIEASLAPHLSRSDRHRLVADLRMVADPDARRRGAVRARDAGDLQRMGRRVGIGVRFVKGGE